MELTFLKLAGSQERGEGGQDRETGRMGKKEVEEEREGSERGKQKSKKDRSAGASLVDGGNGSLGIALSISGPLDNPLAALRPLRSTPFHSIPFHPLLRL